jgi:hypothetical protein
MQKAPTLAAQHPRQLVVLLHVVVWPQGRAARRELNAVPSGADTIITSENAAMTEDHTEAGTPVIELDEREYRAFLEHEVQRGSGLSVADFVRRCRGG